MYNRYILFIARPHKQDFICFRAKIERFPFGNFVSNLKQGELMKRILLVSFLLLLSVGAMFALTGFGVSNTFSITEDTLPVELSSFTATITAQNYVSLSWVTQSESNLLGYQVYRSTDDELSASSLISGLISPTNSSSQQVYAYLDREIVQSGSYYYWLYSQEMDGSGTYHGPITVFVNLEGEQPETPTIPQQTGLRTIYPNPFNPSTTISYQLLSPDRVEISIYNTRGQIVQSFSRHHASAGNFSVLFEGKDSSGNILSSGVYYVLMTAGAHSSNQKIVLMK